MGAQRVDGLLRRMACRTVARLRTGKEMTCNRFADDSVWALHRERIGSDAGVINFNTGTCGPTPRAIQQLVAELRNRQSNSPSDFFWRQLPPRLVYARKRLAEYLNVNPEDLLLLSNVT